MCEFTFVSFGLFAHHLISVPLNYSINFFFVFSFKVDLFLFELADQILLCMNALRLHNASEMFIFVDV